MKPSCYSVGGQLAYIVEGGRETLVGFWPLLSPITSFGKTKLHVYSESHEYEQTLYRPMEWVYMEWNNCDKEKLVSLRK